MSRNVPLGALQLDGSGSGRHGVGHQLPGREASGRGVSAVIDVNTLQSLRIVRLPPLDAVGREHRPGPPPAAVPRRSRRQALSSGPQAIEASALQEPTFDELVRGPERHRAAHEPIAGLPVLLRWAARARVVSPRRAAAPAGPQR